MLDLFTLLSFVLIIVAILKVGGVGILNQVPTEISSQLSDNVRRSQNLLPPGEVLLMLYRDKSDYLIEVRRTEVSRPQVITPSELKDILKSFAGDLSRASRIDLAVVDGAETANSALGLDIERWLTYNGYRKYYVYFGINK
jgi:hypothetical protein